MVAPSPSRRLHARLARRGLRGATSPPTARPTTRSASPRAPRRWCSRCARWASGPATRSSCRRTRSSRPPRPSASSGATPRLVDVDPDTRPDHGRDRRARARRRSVALRDPRAPVRRALSTWTRSSRSPRDAGIAVIEDACQAHGARYRGRRVGTLGDVGCFSFYPAKNLGAWGDGGAVVTTRAELAERVRLLRSHGERPRYRHRVVGTTARLDALQAADPARQAAPPGRLERPAPARGGRAAPRAAGHGASSVAGRRRSPARDHVYHLFVVQTDERDALRAHLTARGIASAVHYPVADPPHRGLRPPRPRAPAALPVAERLAERVCSLPLFPGMTDAQIAARSSRPSARSRKTTRPPSTLSLGHMSAADHGQPTGIARARPSRRASARPHGRRAPAAGRTLDIVRRAPSLCCSWRRSIAVVALDRPARARPGRSSSASAASGASCSPFTVLKFRTMRADADTRAASRLRAQPDRRPTRRRTRAGSLYKLAVDDRVTRVGRSCARGASTSCPQLWNVLRGEMASSARDRSSSTRSSSTPTGTCVASPSSRG